MRLDGWLLGGKWIEIDLRYYIPLCLSFMPFWLSRRGIAWFDIVVDRLGVFGGFFFLIAFVFYHVDMPYLIALHSINRDRSTR